MNVKFIFHLLRKLLRLIVQLCSRYALALFFATSNWLEKRVNITRNVTALLSLDA